MCSNSTENIVTAGANNQFNPKTKLIGVKRAETEYCNSNKIIVIIITAVRTASQTSREILEIP